MTSKTGKGQNPNKILSLEFDNDLMDYFLLNIFVHDYIHDLSPKTSSGRERCNKVMHGIRNFQRGGGNSTFVGGTDIEETQEELKYYIYFVMLGYTKFNLSEYVIPKKKPSSGGSAVYHKTPRNGKTKPQIIKEQITKKQQEVQAILVNGEEVLDYSNPKVNYNIAIDLLFGLDRFLEDILIGFFSEDDYKEDAKVLYDLVQTFSDKLKKDSDFLKDPFSYLFTSFLDPSSKEKKTDLLSTLILNINPKSGGQGPETEPEQEPMELDYWREIDDWETDSDISDVNYWVEPNKCSEFSAFMDQIRETPEDIPGFTDIFNLRFESQGLYLNLNEITIDNFDINTYQSALSQSRLTDNIMNFIRAKIKTYKNLDDPIIKIPESMIQYIQLFVSNFPNNKHESSSSRIAQNQDANFIIQIQKFVSECKRLIVMRLNIIFNANCKDTLNRQKLKEKLEQLTKKKQERKERMDNTDPNQKPKADPYDMKQLWYISQAYAKTGLLSLGLCDYNGNYLRKWSNDQQNQILKLETEIIKNALWPTTSSAISNLPYGLEIDKELYNGIVAIVKDDPRVITNNKPNIYTGTNKFKIVQNPKINYAFMDNALQGQPDFIDFPNSLCTVASLMDGWGSNGCSLKDKNDVPKEDVGIELGSFAFKLTNPNKSSYYQAIVDFDSTNGNVSINLNTSFLVNSDPIITDLKISIYDKKTISAKQVLQRQLDILIPSFNEYLGLFKNRKKLPDSDLWEVFRTDKTDYNNPSIEKNRMLNLMKAGCVKSFGDLFQEILGNAAQLPVYRGNKPDQLKPVKNIPGFQTTNGRDRPIIQAGTDRPSSVGRSVIISLFGKDDQVNNMVFTGYSTRNTNEYIFVLPRSSSSNTDTTTLLGKRPMTPSKPNSKKKSKNKGGMRKTKKNSKKRKNYRHIIKQI